MEKIERIGDHEVLIDGIKYIKDENKPEFKAGQWAAWTNKRSEEILDIYLFYITRFEGNIVYGISNPDKGEEAKCHINKLVSVTKEQIESHLKPICNKRYIGKKVECLHCGEYTIINTPHPSGYDKKYDQFWMIASNSDGVCVYEQGKFAEIIENENSLRNDLIKFFAWQNTLNIEETEKVVDNYLKENERD